MKNTLRVINRLKKEKIIEKHGLTGKWNKIKRLVRDES